MIKTALDTNILFDLLIPESGHTETSKTLLEKALEEGPLVICEVVFSELSTEFKKVSELKTVLKDLQIQVVSSSLEALYLAGNAYKVYKQQKSQSTQCSFCGHTQKLSCPQCHKTIKTKQHILSDFLVGAHASLHANRLLTRDRGFYKNYFSKLKIVE